MRAASSDARPELKGVWVGRDDVARAFLTSLLFGGLENLNAVGVEGTWGI